jgi:competence ComEA-like helix-hairpin-helix protein
MQRSGPAPAIGANALLARNARATLVVAVVLLALGAPSWRSAPAPCLAPSPIESRDGRTLAVRCGGAGAVLEGSARLLFDQGLDPNVADAVSLAVLPGVGVGRAEAIVRERARARFGRVEDLRRVPGIGPTTLERIRPWLVFPPQPVHHPLPVDPQGSGD